MQQHTHKRLLLSLSLLELPRSHSKHTVIISRQFNRNSYCRTEDNPNKTILVPSAFIILVSATAAWSVDHGSGYETGFQPVQYSGHIVTNHTRKNKKIRYNRAETSMLTAYLLYFICFILYRKYSTVSRNWSPRGLLWRLITVKPSSRWLQWY